MNNIQEMWEPKSSILGYSPYMSDDDVCNGYMSDLDVLSFTMEDMQQQPPTKQPTICVQPQSQMSDRCVSLSRNRRITTPKHNRNEKPEWMANERMQEQEREQERYQFREQLPDLYPITPEMRHFPSPASLISPLSNTTISSSINGVSIYSSEKQQENKAFDPTFVNNKRSYNIFNYPLNNSWSDMQSMQMTNNTAYMNNNFGESMNGNQPPIKKRKICTQGSMNALNNGNIPVFHHSTDHWLLNNSHKNTPLMNGCHTNPMRKETEKQENGGLFDLTAVQPSKRALFKEKLSDINIISSQMQTQQKVEENNNLSTPQVLESLVQLAKNQSSISLMNDTPTTTTTDEPNSNANGNKENTSLMTNEMKIDWPMDNTHHTLSNDDDNELPSFDIFPMNMNDLVMDNLDMDLLANMNDSNIFSNGVNADSNSSINGDSIADNSLLNSESFFDLNKDVGYTYNNNMQQMQNMMKNGTNKNTNQGININTQQNQNTSSTNVPVFNTSLMPNRSVSAHSHSAHNTGNGSGHSHFYSTGDGQPNTDCNVQYLRTVNIPNNAQYPNMRTGFYNPSPHLQNSIAQSHQPLTQASHSAMQMQPSIIPADVHPSSAAMQRQFRGRNVNWFRQPTPEPFNFLWWYPEMTFGELTQDITTLSNH